MSELLKPITLIYTDVLWGSLYWAVAFAVSVFWVWDYSTSYTDDSTASCKKLLPLIFSDFITCFAGWVSLYILIANICEARFDAFNIFLATIALLSISGYGYEISKKLGLRDQKKQPEDI